jgi:alpha-1,2-mannosyltransferase
VAFVARSLGVQSRFTDPIPRTRTTAADLRWSLTALALGALVLWSTWRLPRETDFYDLRIYHDAIRSWLHGHELYDYEEPGTGGLGFTYPPFAAVLMAPLGWLSVRSAAWTMTGISLAICGLVGYGVGALIGRRFARPQAVAGVLGIALVLGLEPIRQSLGYGQINVLLLGLVALDMWLVSAGRSGAGAAIGIAAAIKLTPAVLILALFAAGHRTAGRRAVLGFLGASALAAAADPGESWRYWTSTLWQTSRVGKPSGVANQAVSGVLARAMHEAEPSALLWLGCAVAVVGAALWFARRAHGPWADVRLLCVACAASTAASPISWSHHYWWAVPALGAMAYRAARTRSLLAVTALVAAYAAFAVGPSDAVRYLHSLGPWASPILSDLFTFGSLLVCAALVAGRMDPEPSPAAPSPATAAATGP